MNDGHGQSLVRLQADRRDVPPRGPGRDEQRGLPGDEAARLVAEAHERARPSCTRRRKLFELLPQGPNDLWQMDVTYMHIPGYGWWYAVTVIDYYSRYSAGLSPDAQLQRGRDRRTP